MKGLSQIQIILGLVLLHFAQAQSEKGTWFESEKSAENARNWTDPSVAHMPVGANLTVAAGAGNLTSDPRSSDANETVTNELHTVGTPATHGTPTTSNPSVNAATPSVAPANAEGSAEGSEATNPPGEGESPVGGMSEATDMPTGDDNYDKPTEGGDYEGEGEWGGVPEDEGTKPPYIPPAEDDPFSKEPDNESKWSSTEGLNSNGIESPAEMMHDKNVIAAVAVSVGFAFVLALCTAQQVIENPDGCCTRICRCCVGFFCFFFKIIFSPCRMCCGNKDRRTHDLMMGSDNNFTHDLELT